jgi:hypothetical protein
MVCEDVSVAPYRIVLGDDRMCDIRRGYNRAPGQGDAVAAAAPVAFAIVLPIHLWFSATRLGFSLPAASFRYYLPLWPALAHACAYGSATTRLIWLQLFITSVTLAALIIGWISP